MTNLHEIEAAVRGLPSYDLATFRTWFHQFENDMWDSEIEADALSGKLNALASEAKEAARNQQTKPL